jgi:hypothetical protein
MKNKMYKFLSINGIHKKFDTLLDERIQRFDKDIKQVEHKFYSDIKEILIDASESMNKYEFSNFIVRLDNTKEWNKIIKIGTKIWENMKG